MYTLNKLFWLQTILFWLNNTPYAKLRVHLDRIQLFTTIFKISNIHKSFFFMIIFLHHFLRKQIKIKTMCSREK